MKVIYDATEALGTHYTEGELKEKYAGTIGDFGAYSFNGNKIITTGGGAVTANKSEVVDHIRYLSTQAKNDPHYYIHNEVGYNYCMTNLQAALGVAQMEELPEFIRRKQANYDLYCKLFENFKIGKMIGFREGTSSNKWFYSLEVNRDKVKATMRDIYQGEVAYKMEKAPYYAARILNFPSSTQITKEEIEYVAEQIKDVLEGFADGNGENQ